MKRFLTLALLTTVLAVGTNTAAAGVQLGRRVPDPPRPTPSPQPHPPKPHSEGRWIGPCQGWRLGEELTPAVWQSDHERGVRMMQRLIGCVFTTFAPGNSGIALYIADRESSFCPWAVNPSSGASGIFQHLSSYWPGRAAAYLNRGWFGKGAWPASVFDPRANAIAAAKMVAASGWAAWSM